MKILYYSPHPYLNLTSKTGYGTHMREMINAFRVLGHNVLPIINGGTDDVGYSSEKKSIELIKRIFKSIIPSFIWRSVKDYRLLQFDKRAEAALEKQVIAYQPDLIYERAYYIQTSGINVAKKFKIKHYLEVNAPYTEETTEFEKARTVFARTAEEREEKQLISPDKIFVVSSALRDYFTDKIKGINQKNIIVTPNCVNPEKIKVDTTLRIKIEEKYGLKDYTVVGFVGSIFPYHGVDILIDAFNEVYKKNEKIKLLIVGDGLIAPQLKKHAQTLEAANHIIFTGNVSHSDIFSYIDLMDITVLADTKWYCSPIKIFEYGALAKAVIAPDTKAVRDVITNNVDGTLIKPDRSTLTDTLSGLIKNKEAREAMASNFKNKILREYTWVKNAENILANF
jgi:glycosyltransferase involved in cell wall biosynthesis